MNDNNEPPENQQDDTQVPLLQDIVTPGKELFPPLPGTIPADSATVQELQESSISEHTATPERIVPEIAGLELQPLMEQIMQELRQELDGRISTIIGQALEDTLHSTLHRYETQLQQRIMTHLQQHLPELIQARLSDSHHND